MTHNLQIGDTRTNPETGIRERWNGQFWERIDAGSINEPSKKNKTTGTKPPKRPTMIFVIGLILSVVLVLMGILILVWDTALWNYTWMILPTFVIGICVFTLLFLLSKKADDFQVFMIPLGIVIMTIPVIALGLSLLGYTWLLAVGYLMSSINLVLAFICAYLAT